MTFPASLLPRRCGWGLPSLLCALTLLLFSPQGAGAAVDPARAQKYREFAATVDPAALKQTIQALSTHGSRVVGYPGERFAADYVKREMGALLGAQNVSEQQWTATVPMDKGATLTANGKAYRLYSLWPNLVRTSKTPPEGLTGPLIYAGNGQLSAFNGKEVENAIVLVDFNSGSEWLNAPRLGAKAVVFIEPDRTMRGEAEAKFVSIPLSIPRFYIKKSEAAALQAMQSKCWEKNATLESIQANQATSSTNAAPV